MNNEQKQAKTKSKQKRTNKYKETNSGQVLSLFGFARFVFYVVILY